MRLQGKRALITGASRGIGRGIAEIFAEEGADVVVNYVSQPEKAEEVAKWIRAKGRNAMTVKADVSKRAEVESMGSFGRSVRRRATNASPMTRRPCRISIAERSTPPAMSSRQR